MSVAESLRRNVERVRRRIAAACERTARDPGSVRLVAVTKSAPVEWIGPLVDLGIHDLGESRPQQLVERAALVAGPVSWHLVGHLQRNKARRALAVAEFIHSVDSLRLLAALDALAAELAVRPKLFLEVNVSGEASKDGFAPSELSAAVDSLSSLRHVDVVGLMTMAPLADDTESARSAFRALRTLRDALAERVPTVPLRELSMGMTGDFETAIEEGATCVRIGSALFDGVEQ